MYKRNIDILDKYKNFDFEVWRPTSELKFLKKPNSLLEMNGLPVQIRPNHVFYYGAKDKKSLGGIWFITWLEGFKRSDLGIYSEALYRYLTSYFSEEYEINPASCITVDVSSTNSVGYNEIINGEIPSLLDSTLSELKKFI
ncbi:hypothetical protein [Winogradskyella sp.]|uniref:hypothetical protein n=1 Tax=Winogradskyella sp. TaxID=1883156 RepID=UPI00260C4DC2|nr:hypothetical protein [Winogradskyella sp.]